jgi:hypothetical protein
MPVAGDLIALRRVAFTSVARLNKPVHVEAPRRYWLKVGLLVHVGGSPVDLALQ